MNLSRERIASPSRFLNRWSRQSLCSVCPSRVTSDPNPEVTRKNQSNSLSERSLIHSINRLRIKTFGRHHLASEGKYLPAEVFHSHPVALEVLVPLRQLDPLVGEIARSAHDRVD